MSYLLGVLVLVASLSTLNECFWFILRVFGVLFRYEVDGFSRLRSIRFWGTML